MARWGEEEQKDALASMRLWAEHQKTQGKNFFGQELKVDPSKGKGAAAQANVVNAKKTVSTASENVSKALTTSTKSAVDAAQTVGTQGLENLSIMSQGMGSGALGTGAINTGPLNTQLKIATNPATTVANTTNAANTANALKVGTDAAATASASTGLQAAASSAMPYLLAAQLALGFLGAKDDEEGWLGIRPSGNPWGAAGTGGTGVVG